MTTLRKVLLPRLFLLLCVAVFGIVIGLIIPWVDLNSAQTLSLIGVLLFSSILVVQSVVFVYVLSFHWNDSQNSERKNILEACKQTAPTVSFTTLVPARDEAEVIADTITSLVQIQYPKKLHQILLIMRSDDTKTIAAAQKQIDVLKASDQVEIVSCESLPSSKPESLNIGLRRAKNEVIGVFDAEDSPHPQILAAINYQMTKTSSDVVQSGVQLMNFQSRWFSALNVLEYYFWFKSALHFFAHQKAIPLAGNTVFFKKKWLEKIGGWDQSCLTEDAEIGIRLLSEGAKISVLYEPELATREETPGTVSEFIKQRTRWNQGFLQIFEKGVLSSLPTLKQQLFFGYILLLPMIVAATIIGITVSFLWGLTLNLPVVVVLVSATPLLIQGFQILFNCVAMYEFTRDYSVKCTWKLPVIVIITYIPYILLLTIGALRALQRHLTGTTSWEKTRHNNTHRLLLDQ